MKNYLPSEEEQRRALVMSRICDIILALCLVASLVALVAICLLVWHDIKSRNQLEAQRINAAPKSAEARVLHQMEQDPAVRFCLDCQRAVGLR